MRITPADAGKTTFMADIAACIWDHPRRCGENTRARLHQPPPMGSPPQVRGKPAEKTGQVYQMGITPAGAGKTCAAAISACLSQDHPRRCGENLMNPC